MSDPGKRGKSRGISRRSALDHKFVVRHQVKQRILLRALEQMSTSGETASESRAATAMMLRLEELLSRRQRRMTLEPTPPRKPRKRCTYGRSENDPHNTLQ